MSACPGEAAERLLCSALVCRTVPGCRRASLQSQFQSNARMRQLAAPQAVRGCGGAAAAGAQSRLSMCINGQ